MSLKNVRDPIWTSGKRDASGKRGTRAGSGTGRSGKRDGSVAKLGSGKRDRSDFAKWSVSQITSWLAWPSALGSGSC